MVVVVAYGSGGREEEGWQERGKSGMKGVRRKGMRRGSNSKRREEEGGGRTGNKDEAEAGVVMVAMVVVAIARCRTSRGI